MKVVPDGAKDGSAELGLDDEEFDGEDEGEDEGLDENWGECNECGAELDNGDEEEEEEFECSGPACRC